MNQNTKKLRRRQKELESRLDRSWHPQRDLPVLESGNIRYELSDRVSAVNCGGLGLLQTVVKTVGLARAIDESLSLLKRHLPYHESDHVLSLAYNILTGGQCLEDLEVRRQDVVYLNALGAQRIPDPTTAGDFLRRFGVEDVEGLMDAINRVRCRVWSTQPEADRRLALIDVDGTIAETHGHCKEHMDLSYDGRWGFGPLVVSLANTQEVLFAVNRPASRPSHDGAAKWMDKAASWAHHEAGFERVRLRGDTDFSLTRNFDRWSKQGIEFVFGMDSHRSFVQRAEALADKAWRPLKRPAKPQAETRRRARRVKEAVAEQKGYKALHLEEEHVAEMPHSPDRAKGTYRLVVLRKRIRVLEGQLRLEDEIRYFFYITNVTKRRLGTAAVVRQSNARCHQENLIEQLKNGVQATRLPVREFNANWAYLVIGSLAWNLKAWTGMLLPKNLGAREIVRMEFRRFLREVISMPAQILTTGRSLVFRLLAVNRWTRLLLEGAPRLQQWRLA